jgi:hypothetical protein
MHYCMKIRWSLRCRDKSAFFNPAPRYAPQTFGYQFYHLSSITEVLSLVRAENKQNRQSRVAASHGRRARSPSTLRIGRVISRNACHTGNHRSYKTKLTIRGIQTRFKASG